MKWWIERDKLHSEQIKILDLVKESNDNFFLEGPAGSGKTLLAIHFALDAILVGKSALLVTYTNSLVRLFETILEKIAITSFSKNVIICRTFERFNEYQLLDFDVIIFDEVQDINIPFKLKNEEIYSLKKIIFIGDYNQKLYEARGNKIALQNRYKCKCLLLNITFRCPQKLLDFASKYKSTKPDNTTSNNKNPFHLEIKKIKDYKNEVDFITKNAIEKYKTGEFVLILFFEHAKAKLFINTLLESHSVVGAESLINKNDYSVANEFFENLNVPFQFYGNLLNGSFENIIQKNKVTFMTIHSSKGLQADSVFIPFLDDNIYSFTSKGELTATYPLYVATTRAMKSLYLTYSSENDPLAILCRTDIGLSFLQQIDNPI